MAKYNANSGADNGSVAEIGFGTVYIRELDANDNPIVGTDESLGLNTAITINFERTSTNFDHTLFDKSFTMKTLDTALNVTCDITFEEFKLPTISKFLNSDVTKKAASVSETIEFSVPVGRVTLDRGFTLPIEGGIATLTSVTMGTSQVLVEGENYIVNSGSIYFMSVREQDAADAALTLDTTTTASELEVVVQTSASETVEFETKAKKNFGLYLEMYNSFDETQLKQIWLHKGSITVDSLPIKTDGEDLQNYTATFSLLASKAVKDPSKSKFFKIVTSKRS